MRAPEGQPGPLPRDHPTMAQDPPFSLCCSHTKGLVGDSPEFSTSFFLWDQFRAVLNTGSFLCHISMGQKGDTGSKIGEQDREEFGFSLTPFPC